HVTGDAAGRLADLLVWEEAGGRDVFLDLLRLDMPPAPALGVRRARAHVLRQIVPLVADRVAFERAGDEVLQRSRSVPWPLIVRVKHVAGGIKANSARRTNPAGEGDRLALRRDFHAPAAEFRLAGE